MILLRQGWGDLGGKGGLGYVLVNIFLTIASQPKTKQDAQSDRRSARRTLRMGFKKIHSWWNV